MPRHTALAAKMWALNGFGETVQGVAVSSPQTRPKSGSRAAGGQVYTSGMSPGGGNVHETLGHDHCDGDPSSPRDRGRRASEVVASESSVSLLFSFLCRLFCCAVVCALRLVCLRRSCPPDSQSYVLGYLPFRLC